MARLRLLLAWILLVAIPLQGFAASSMLFCGVAEPVAATATDGMAHAHHHMATATMDDADGAAEMASMSHDTETALPDAPHRHTGSAHTCGVCAACAQAAITVSVAVSAPAVSAPRRHMQALPSLARSRALAVPDKPPRA